MIIELSSEQPKHLSIIIFDLYYLAKLYYKMWRIREVIDI